MEKLNTAEIIRRILDDVDSELKDEELLQMILERSIVRDSSSIDTDSRGQRAADKLANFAGSWTFVIGFTCFLLIWIIVNSILMLRAFDPFPFILLNLLLSSLAAVQAPLIMMSQNRQEQKDRRRAQNDYKINLKTEVIIRDIHYKMEDVRARLAEVERRLGEVNDGQP